MRDARKEGWSMIEKEGERERERETRKQRRE